VGATFKPPNRSRLSADVALGSWRQNETPFIPFTTNTSIQTPPLPASKLDGKIDTTSISAFFTSQLADNFRINARFRRYDLDNKTPRLRFEEGYVRFDAVLEEIPRISVPYGYTNSRFEASASYDFGKVTLEGGYNYVKMDRTFRETEQTTDNGFVVKADVRGSEWVLLRGSFEHFKRDFDAYDTEASEEASFLDPGAPANQLILRRYDQAKKDVNRFGASVQITPPSGKAAVILSYFRTKDDYNKDPVLNHLTGQSESPLGLLDATYDSFSAEVDFTPNERATFYAFYSHERNDNFQAGRQSGGSLSTNPLDGWTASVEDKIDSVGGGGNFILVPDKWNLDIFGRYQKVDGNNDLFSPPGGSPDTATSIPLYDDTKIVTFSAQITYQIATAWALSVGGLFEDYEIRDAQTGGILNYMPGSFFLAANDGDYQAKVGYLQLRYRF
jgi:Putative outer membrane beta-barrel porin, MtrB/PioB